MSGIGRTTPRLGPLPELHLRGGEITRDGESRQFSGQGMAGNKFCIDYVVGWSRAVSLRPVEFVSDPSTLHIEHMEASGETGVASAGLAALLARARVADIHRAYLAIQNPRAIRVVEYLHRSGVIEDRFYASYEGGRPKLDPTVNELIESPDLLAPNAAYDLLSSSNEKSEQLYLDGADEEYIDSVVTIQTIARF